MLATLLFIVSFVFGQPFSSFGEEKAYEGAVVLASEQVITGTFFFDEKNDLLYRKKEKGLELYPTYRIKAFFFYDPAQQLNRKFIMLATKGSDYPYGLYEIVLRGELNVLRKRNARSMLAEAEEKAAWSQHHVRNYHYYLLLEGELLDLRRFSSELFPLLMAKEGEWVENFLKEHKLNIHREEGIIQLIKAYNALRKAEPQPFLF